jgi:hypothetical protein
MVSELAERRRRRAAYLALAQAILQFDDEAPPALTDFDGQRVPSGREAA